MSHGGRPPAGSSEGVGPDDGSDVGAVDAGAVDSGALDAGAAEERSRASDAALTYLSHRPRSAEEVRRKLRRLGYPAPTVDEVVADLARTGLLDDESFVGAYVRGRIAHRPMGVRRLADELFQRGIPRERSLPAIEEALAAEGIDELDLATRAAEKRLRALRERGDDAGTLRRQLAGHLNRRGFRADIGIRVVDHLIGR